MIRIRTVDVETTGMPEAEGGAEIVEIGWCDVAVELDDPVPGAVRAWIEPGRWGSQLCNPGRPIPPEAMAVHHIRDAEVVDMPPAAAVLDNVMGGRSNYFCAHNADFERKFITNDVKWICSYKVALRLWPDSSHHSNQFLRYSLPLHLEDEALAMPPHRAGPDSYVTAHLLVMELESGKASIEDMVRWSNGPALLPRVNFGKHKGAKWDDVPLDYLSWIVDKSDMDRDIKANAKHWLKVRSQ